MATLNITPTAMEAVQLGFAVIVEPIHMHIFSPASLETPWENFIIKMLGCFNRKCLPEFLHVDEEGKTAIFSVFSVEIGLLLCLGRDIFVYCGEGVINICKHINKNK